MNTSLRNVLALAGTCGLVSSAALLGGACGSGRDEFKSETQAPPLAADDGGAEPVCVPKLRCSSDLKRVIRLNCDGTEELERQCGPDFGCGEGTCIEPCRSAELAKGSIGCSFAAVPPDSTVGDGSGSCFATTIANVWDRPVTISAMIGPDPIDVGPSTYYVSGDAVTTKYTRVDGPIAPGRVAIVFLAKSLRGGSVDCPRDVTPALLEDPIGHGTTRTRAFRLTTDAPVSAYQIWPYGGALGYYPSATLLLPRSSWDTRYITVSTWTTGNTPSSSGTLGWPFLQIVAAEDDTEVRMRAKVNVSGGRDVEGMFKGETQTWTLKAGEVLQIKQRDDASGSPIETSKPVALFGGSDCVFIPVSAQACDSTHQQIPAVSQWGSEYALVPYRPRNDFGTGMTTAREKVPWRLVGAADGTKLTYDPVRPGSAPETLEAGQVADFMTTQLVSVRSQDAEHPFHAAMFMTGSTAVPGALGDPEFVNVVPAAQFLERYIFFADHTYRDTTLTFVRRRTPAGFHPVTLDCAGEITDWAPLGKSGEYEFAWLYTTKGGVAQTYPGGTCGHGRHEASSDGPFSVHVWGTSAYASYGYAGGQGSRPLHDVKGPSLK